MSWKMETRTRSVYTKLLMLSYFDFSIDFYPFFYLFFFWVALLIHILGKNLEAMYLRDEDGRTPLHYAASTGYHKGACELLVRCPNLALVWDTKGHLPIHLACKRDHVDVVENFLDQKSPNVRDMLTQQGQNILHIAAENGRNNTVKYLLDKGRLEKFTINEKDKDGNTALHMAAMRFNPKVLYFLSRDDRVELSIKNNEDFTAYGIAWLHSKVPLRHREVWLNSIYEHIYSCICLDVRSNLVIGA